MARVKRKLLEVKRQRPRSRKPRGTAGDLPVDAFIECLFAVHLSSYVAGPFHERSGLMVVGPPSVLKSTLLSFVPRNYPNAIELSDVNVPGLIDLRDQLASGVLRTLVLSDLGKIYERHPTTARNLEGHLRAMTGEGFTAASFQDSRINRLRARGTLMAAMVPELQEEHFKRWENTGWNRRFLWSLIVLHDPHLLTRAVERWQLLDFHLRSVPPIPSGEIPNLTTVAQRRALNAMLRWQPGGGQHATQLTLMTRMLAVLIWHYRRSKLRGSPMDTMALFARSLAEGGASLVMRRKGDRR